MFNASDDVTQTEGLHPRSLEDDLCNFNRVENQLKWLGDEKRKKKNRKGTRDCLLVILLSNFHILLWLQDAVADNWATFEEKIQ